MIMVKDQDVETIQMIARQLASQIADTSSKARLLSIDRMLTEAKFGYVTQAPKS